MNVIYYNDKYKEALKTYPCRNMEVFLINA